MQMRRSRVMILVVGLFALVACALAVPVAPAQPAQAQGIDPTIAKAQSDILRRQGEIAAEQRRIAALTAEARQATAWARATEDQAAAWARATERAEATANARATATAIRAAWIITATATAAAGQTSVAQTGTSVARTATATAQAGYATATAAVVAEQKKQAQETALFWVRLLLCLILGFVAFALGMAVLETVKRARQQAHPPVVAHYTAVIEDDAPRPMRADEKDAALDEALAGVRVAVETSDQPERVADIVEALRESGIRPAGPDKSGES